MIRRRGKAASAFASGVEIKDLLRTAEIFLANGKTMEGNQFVCFGYK